MNPRLLTMCIAAVAQVTAEAGEQHRVHLRLEGDATHDAAVRALEDGGHPVVRLRLNDPYDLGGQFLRSPLARPACAKAFAA